MSIEQKAKAEEKKGPHPLNPSTVLTPVMTHPLNMFDNGPIHQGQDEAGNGVYLDWADAMTSLNNEVRALNEAILHRDPEAARLRLLAVEGAASEIREYLTARKVVG